MLYNKIFWTVNDIESIIDKLTSLQIWYAKNAEEEQAIENTINIYKYLIWDLRRETAKADNDTRYEDYFWNFHNV